MRKKQEKNIRNSRKKVGRKPVFLKVIIFANNRIKKMMKLAIIFLPIVFALIWALFIGLRINKVETRDGKRKLINY